MMNGLAILHRAINSPALSFEDVFSTYTIKSKQIVSTVTGVYNVHVTAKPSLQRLIKIYPAWVPESGKRNPGKETKDMVTTHNDENMRTERDIQVSTSLSGSDGFGTVIAVGVIKADGEALYPFAIQEYTAPSIPLMFVDIRMWSWTEKISCLARIMTALQTARASHMDQFSHNALHPYNILLIKPKDDEKESTKEGGALVAPPISRKDEIVLNHKKLQVRSPHIQLVDFHVAQTPEFDSLDTNYKFDVPNALIEYCAKFVGLSNAFAIMRWARGNEHVSGSGGINGGDRVVTNMYLMLFTVVQKLETMKFQRTKPPPKSFVERMIASVDKEVFASAFRDLHVVEGDTDGNMSNVGDTFHDDFIAKVLLCFPLFGLYHTHTAVSELRQDLHRLQHRDSDFTYALRIPTNQGVHGLYAPDSSTSLSVEFVSDFSELCVEIGSSTISLSTFPEHNMRFIYPVSTLLADTDPAINHLVDLIPGTAFTEPEFALHIDSLSYNVFTRKFQISAQVFVKSGGGQSPKEDADKEGHKEVIDGIQLDMEESELGEVLLHLLPNPALLLSQLWSARAVQPMDTYAFLTAHTPDGPYSVTHDDLKLTSYLYSPNVIAENQTALTQTVTTT